MFTVDLSTRKQSLSPLPVVGSKEELASKIDQNNDTILDRDELEQFVCSDSELHASCNHSHARKPQFQDKAALTRELGLSLTGAVNPDRASYHSYAAVLQEFDQLALDHPGYVQKHVLGQTPEGRDIVAYKFSENAQGDTSHKTGVVITGCHHAREWMTVEASLKLGRDLLNGLAESPEKTKRLQDAEIWIVPCANPDGYEYSRNVDPMWRKNRRPLETDQNGKPTRAIGVDLNRNYGDPQHPTIYRPDGDKPGTTLDDFSATSDDPNSETYRGPEAASEPETRALLQLEKRPNIKGLIDYHSFGDDIFYPWDHTREEPANAALYKEICPKISQATGWSFAQGANLYMNAGDSTDTLHANGLLTLCFEMGQSFQPPPREIPRITSQASAGTQVFIDEVVKHDKLGEIPRPVASA